MFLLSVSKPSSVYHTEHVARFDIYTSIVHMEWDLSSVTILHNDIEHLKKAHVLHQHYKYQFLTRYQFIFECKVKNSTICLICLWVQGTFGRQCSQRARNMLRNSSRTCQCTFHKSKHSSCDDAAYSTLLRPLPVTHHNFANCSVWVWDLVSHIKEKQSPTVFENRVLRKISGATRRGNNMRLEKTA